MRELHVAGYALIKKFEGLKLKAYHDITGLITVGYGHTGPDVKENTVWTQDQAEAALKADVAGMCSKVTGLLGKYKVTDNQFAALVSFAYNLGSGRLAKSTLLTCLLKGNEKDAGGEFLRWSKAGGVVVKGLLTRREEERSLFLSGLDTLPRS